MPLLSAFLDPRNDDLFATIASFSNARELAELDVSDQQREARAAIFDAIVHALKRDPSPGSRIALVKGEAGSGKSHVLTTMLRDFASITENKRHSVYAAILQLTAPVTVAEYDVWLLDAVIRELSARHFGDDANRSPLRRLAGGLLDFAEEDIQQNFRREIEDLDSDGEIEIALKIGRRIAREGRVWLQEDLAPGFIGAVLLAGFGDTSALNYLRYGQLDPRAAQLLLVPITTASQRIETIRSLARLVQLVGGCLVLGFDQVENTIRLGDEGLFVHALTQAVRLVENISNAAVVIAVLADEFDSIALGRRSDPGLATTDWYRITGEAPFPANLNAEAPEFRRAVIARRLEILRERAHLPVAANLLAPLPDWLLPRIDASRTVRLALREVAEFRTEAMKRGRLPTQAEYLKDRPDGGTTPPEIDFAKAWADCKDRGSSTIRRLLDSQKADLMVWWVAEASREHTTAEPITSHLVHLDDAFSTPVVEIALSQNGQVIERRALALCEAPNQNQKLAEQVKRFLESSDGAIPFALRSRSGFPKGRTAQAAPMLENLRALGGQTFNLNDTEWDLLARAHEFFEAQKAAPGLLAWRRDAQWLRQLLSPLLPLITLPEMIELQPGPGTHPGTIREPPVDTGGDRQSEPHDQSELHDAIGNGAEPAIQPPPPELPTGGRTFGAGDATQPVDETGTTSHLPDTPATPPPTRRSLPPGLPPTGSAQEPFPVLIGTAEDNTPVSWAPYAAAPNHLNNFSMLVTGDAGSGKTQTIRVLIDAACRAGLAVTIFDFKADYCDPKFAAPLGLKVVDVRTQGLPFNPLEPPPRGASGAQPIEHAYEIAGILARVFRLGAVQEARLRDAICDVYRACGVDPQEWVQPSTVSWPSFNRVVDLLAEAGDNGSLVSRLGALKDFQLFGAGGPSPNRAAEFFQGRVCLQLSTLPNDDIKTAIAEILIVQLHGHLLRGEQPRRLTRLLVFDEAHRVKDSRRLEQLAREGRAFGVGIVIGTQFPGDMPSDIAGNLATQLFLMNNQAAHRRAIATQVCGTVSSPKARALLDRLGRLKPLQGLFSNPHYGAVFVDILPHYARGADAPAPQPQTAETPRTYEKGTA